jgi:hypothetical protein
MDVLYMDLSVKGIIGTLVAAWIPQEIVNPQPSHNLPLRQSRLLAYK